ncbi:DUF1990 family protein [Monashia sp. NPDC004114]
MSVQRLDEDRAAQWRLAPLTYSPDDLAGGSVPHGYRRLECTAALRRRDFPAAVDDLMGWRMHEKAGLRVEATDIRARPGTVVVMYLGVGRLALQVPCRVVAVVDEPSRQGFSYGTLPGHPESGEESFVLDHRADGSIQLTVAAVSRPASLPARLGGPLTRAAQAIATRRYLSALDRL